MKLNFQLFLLIFIESLKNVSCNDFYEFIAFYSYDSEIFEVQVLKPENVEPYEGYLTVFDESLHVLDHTLVYLNHLLEKNVYAIDVSPESVLFILSSCK